MNENGTFHINDIAWKELRGLAVTKAAYKVLADRSYTDGAYSLEYTRVGVGGASPPHVEGWGHLFYILSGKGEINIQGKSSPIQAGSVCPVRAGQEHTFANTGDEDLLMLVIYHPPRTRA